MTFTIDRAKFKTETGRKLYDLLVKIGDYDDFVIGVLCEVKGDEKRQKLIDIIERENITDEETIAMLAGDIANGDI